MGFATDLSAARGAYPDTEGAQKHFARIQAFGDRAVRDLPAHRASIRQIYGGLRAIA
jgi:hypothetical protein